MGLDKNERSSVDVMRSVFWVIREVVRGRVTNFRLLRLLYYLYLWRHGGYRHNFSITDTTSTFKMFGKKRSTPLARNDLCQVEWKLIQDNIGCGLVGKRVIDIGSNDGFFSIECAKLGGWNVKR